MATRGQRADGLSKERIVALAIDILDSEGEGALTFRALTSMLATGSGAIYWHVANKDELLAAATADVLSRVVDGATDPSAPDALRELLLGLFDAVDAHPWLGTQLVREPWQPAVTDVFEALGRRVQALGVAEDRQFDATTALLNYVLGLAGQHAAAARLVPRGVSRQVFLEAIADRWRDQDAERYPFLHQVAGQVGGHDDRAQFLAGIDLILAGIAAQR